MRPSESTGTFACDEALVEERVVRGLDAALADDLARLCVLVCVGLELLRVDLPEQAEELAAEGALRIVPAVLDADLEAREPSAPLLQVRS